MRATATVFALLILALTAAGDAAGQARYTTLRGAVIDDETGEPLPGVHVFIAASMIGTTTNAQGRYRLERVPLGAHRLYVTMLGFDAMSQDIVLNEARPYAFNFSLRPRVYELDSVVVVARRDRRWKRRLKKFNALFIGETPFADKTEIINPEVLSFADENGIFSARAAAPLVIENRALGYRLRYHLMDFYHQKDRIRYQGEPLFEELTPRNQKEAAMWASNRRQAFHGSLRHFLLSLLDGTTEAEGFVLYEGRSARGPRRNPEHNRIEGSTLLQEGPLPVLKELTFQHAVEVVYTKEFEDTAYLDWINRPYATPGPQESWLLLEVFPALVDIHGTLIDPYTVTMAGYLSFSRVAEMLPKEYRPE